MRLVDCCLLPKSCKQEHSLRCLASATVISRRTSLLPWFRAQFPIWHSLFVVFLFLYKHQKSNLGLQWRNRSCLLLRQCNVNSAGEVISQLGQEVKSSTWWELLNVWIHCNFSTLLQNSLNNCIKPAHQELSHCPSNETSLFFWTWIQLVSLHMHFCDKECRISRVYRVVLDQFQKDRLNLSSSVLRVKKIVSKIAFIFYLLSLCNYIVHNRRPRPSIPM